MDEEDYGDIADEDLINVLSQASQTLPLLPHWSKRRRVSSGTNDGEEALRNASGGEEDGNARSKKKKYRMHIGVKEVPETRIMGATQAEGHPDSSPYRIRGPIYRKPRLELHPERPILPARALTTARKSNTMANAFLKQPKTPSQNDEFARALENLPSDAFSSSENDQEPMMIRSSPPRNTQVNLMPRQRLVPPQNGLRQTTLFGGRAPEEISASQAKKVHNFKVDLPPETQTHHVLDHEALQTWVYPTNLGTIRDYQFSIVRNGLFNNLLVALPTGLGKTFIAATIMLNFFRWTKDAQIVFVAPTKPLVAQQAEACFGIVGIPKSKTTMLTGEQPPVIRAEEWAEKRVFFMTPQTLENDLGTGIADPKKIVLLVVDEAHRATGNYAYVKVVKFMRRFNKSFRIIALTATPGSNVEAVQEVIDGLEISKVEIRTEESIDIQQYVHTRNIDQIVLDPSEEIVFIRESFSKALQPLVNQLCGQNGYWNKDPMSLTPFGLIQAKKQWFASSAGRAASQGLKGMMVGLFTILASVAHGIKLLNFHGIGPFFSSIKEFRQGVEEGNKGGKYRTQIVENPDFKIMMDRMQMWINTDGFVGHPKLTCLCDTILNHFMDAGEGRMGEDTPPSSTRVIVFAEFRDSAEEICRVLNRHGPMVRASVFVGQADCKRSGGMNQAKQLETIRKFKMGSINVIVATSIGEEGLDIGQVDLIVCYDASASPIRMLQRMGRTGRKRAGNIVLLLMRGKEEDSFAKAKDNYEQMQKIISSGARFNFRHDLSVRIIPREITPNVDKRLIEIPIENTQDPSLPEPKRRARKGKKMPAKKFHMPDGVEIGFHKASNLSGGGPDLTGFGVTIKKKKEVPKSQLVTIPPVESVLLNEGDMEELERRYQNVAGTELQEVTMPDMTAHPYAQRSLGATINVPHGQYTKRCVGMFMTLAELQRPEDRFLKPYGDKGQSRDFLAMRAVAKRTSVPNPRKAPRHVLVMSDAESDMEEAGPTSTAPTAGVETEGEGDDLVNSEEVSEDSEVDGSSMLDFVVYDELASSSDLRRGGGQPSTSSSSPPIEKPKRKASASTKDMSIFSQAPTTYGRNKRRRMVVEDDSDV